MKKLIVVLAFLPLFSYSQNNQLAGDQLRLAAKHWYTGLVINSIGSGLMLTSLMSSRQDKVVLIVGGVFQVAGLIFMAESWSHIGKAGGFMTRKKIAFTGSGIIYRI